MPDPRRLTAKYPGWCRGCGAAIEEGDTIWWDGQDSDGARTWHEDCLPNGELGPDE